MHAARPPLSVELEAEVERLTNEYEALAEVHGDDPAEDVMDRLEAIDDEIARLWQRESVWCPQDVARSATATGTVRRPPALPQAGRCYAALGS